VPNELIIYKLYRYGHQIVCHSVGSEYRGVDHFNPVDKDDVLFFFVDDLMIFISMSIYNYFFNFIKGSCSSFWSLFTSFRISRARKKIEGSKC